MRTKERWDYLRRSLKLGSDILIRGRLDFTFDLMPFNVSQMSLARRFNLIRSAANLAYRRLQPWSWPSHMQIELTNYCNLKCRVCPTGLGKLNRPPKAMDVALFERLMNEVGPYLMTASLWAWGEPLLHPQLSDILRIAQKQGMATLISTNGQNLSDENVLKALVNYPPTYLIVALDGITDETNSLFRVGAKIDKALTGVHRLVRMRAQKGSKLPIVHLRYIVMKHNEHELPYLPKFAAENEFDIMTIRTLSIIDAPEETHHNLLPSSERYQAYGYENNKRVSRTDFVCEMAFTFPTVFADGTVVACDQDCRAQQPYGSLAGGSSFADIWWSRHASEVRKTIRDNPSKFSFCKNCPFRDRPISTCSVEFLDLRK